MAVELDTDGNKAIDINLGGTNAKTASEALSNLGGQPYDADLDILSSGTFSQKRALIEAFAKPVLGVDALRTTMADFDGDARYLTYHTSIGDGGHGMVVWDSTSTAADDNGVTIAVTGVATGRWVRQLNGFVTPEMFGCDGIDDHVQIQAAVNTKMNVIGGGPTKTYNIGEKIILPPLDNTTLYRKQQIIDFRGATMYAASEIDACFELTSGPWPLNNTRKRILNVIFRGFINDCILLTGNHHWGHEFAFLSTVGGPGVGAFNSVVHIQNTLMGSGANPGLISIHDIWGLSSTTLSVIKMSSDNPVQIDDLTVKRVYVGDIPIVDGTKTVLIYAHVEDCYGQSHGVNLANDGSYMTKSTIEGIYIEAKNADTYGFNGIGINNVFDRINMYVPDHTIQTGCQAVRLLSGTLGKSNDNSIGPVSLISSALGVAPYATVPYPIVYIQAGYRNKIKGINPDYLVNAVEYGSTDYSAFTGTVSIDSPKNVNKSATYNLTLNDNGFTFTNDSATANVLLYLPSAQVGLKYTFYRTNATYTIRVLNSFGHTINGIGTSITLSAQYDCITLECIKTGQWTITAQNNAPTTP
jgi:hypothetical protein